MKRTPLSLGSAETNTSSPSPILSNKTNRKRQLASIVTSNWKMKTEDVGTMKIEAVEIVKMEDVETVTMEQVETMTLHWNWSLLRSRRYVGLCFECELVLFHAL